MNKRTEKSFQKKVKLSSYNNDWYHPGKSKFAILLWLLTSAIFFRNPLFLSSFLKKKILKLFGAKIGREVVIKPCVNIKYPWLLKVGNNVWIGENVWIDNLAEVLIGNNVCLSQGVMLLTGNHDYKKTTFDLIVGKIILEDGVWIGAQAIVCPKVTCQSHSILAVKSVATKDLEPYSIYKGNPAEKIRTRKIS